MFDNPAVETLKAAYKHLVKKFNIDTLILVDGGVDSLMRGNEQAPGSLLEDTISLIAIEDLDVPTKILATIGFGTEVEEGVCHHHALENMAALTKARAFYGSCSLLPQMIGFDKFEARVATHGISKQQTLNFYAVHGVTSAHALSPQHMANLAIIACTMMRRCGVLSHP
ncbi:MAG: DUF1152 domain-containing protein [Anaerolineae bacterium]|nr:DUF1152 domain-containing protein [Anaerolineae bacterium]